ncbi:hypothetical protein H2248_004462 [Termitomyces sp. 'cryptogamus']|nr:hypothetical protein H2248_004462 [Termitomyces sp. 'cryptogamus']
MTAKLRAAQDPTYIERKAKKTRVEDMELEVRMRIAKQKLEEFDRKLAEGLNKKPAEFDKTPAEKLNRKPAEGVHESGITTVKPKVS